MQSSLLLLLALTLLIVSMEAFAPATLRRKESLTQCNGVFDKVGEFFAELDAFVDDATSRRLGNGSKFYGKRRSNFYGSNDKDRKRDRTVADPTGEMKYTQFLLDS